MNKHRWLKWGDKWTIAEFRPDEIGFDVPGSDEGGYSLESLRELGFKVEWGDWITPPKNINEIDWRKYEDYRE